LYPSVKAKDKLLIVAIGTCIVAFAILVPAIPGNVWLRVFGGCHVNCPLRPADPYGLGSLTFWLFGSGGIFYHGQYSLYRAIPFY
jgi:hypothetical protein